MLSEMALLPKTGNTGFTQSHLRLSVCQKNVVYFGQMTRGPALDLRSSIESRVAAEPGRVWTPVDFLDLGPRAAVDKSLQRLAASGRLSRIDRGLYYRAGTNSLTRKPTTPDIRAIVDAIVLRDQIRIVVDGLTAANDLGLTTAVPARVTLLTDARLRPIQIGNQKIVFQAVAPSRLYWAGRPAMRVVQALYWLQDLLDSDRENIVRRLLLALHDPDYGAAIRDDLREGLHTLPTWMQSIVRQLVSDRDDSRDSVAISNAVGIMARMPPEVTAHERNLREVFTDGRTLPVHIVRLSVLFEDLRLESFGAREMGSLEPLDKIGKHYRYFYFLRRMLVSLDEFAGALNQINANAEWKQIRATLDLETEKRWYGAVKYFGTNRPKWQELRNWIGGHFLEKAAAFAISNFNEDAIGKIEIVMDREEQKGGIRLQYVEEIVATAMKQRLGPGEHSEEEFRAYINDLFTVMMTAVNEAVKAVHIIAVFYVVDRFRKQ